MKMAPTEPAGAAKAISLGSDKRSEDSPGIEAMDPSLSDDKV
jgi:hypothetical protein